LLAAATPQDTWQPANGKGCRRKGRKLYAGKKARKAQKEGGRRMKEGTEGRHRRTKEGGRRKKEGTEGRHRRTKEGGRRKEEGTEGTEGRRKEEGGRRKEGKAVNEIGTRKGREKRERGRERGRVIESSTCGIHLYSAISPALFIHFMCLYLH